MCSGHCRSPRPLMTSVSLIPTQLNWSVPQWTCCLVFCMRSPTSFSRALLWKNNEILWMSSDFSHCLERQVKQTDWDSAEARTPSVCHNKRTSLNSMWTWQFFCLYLFNSIKVASWWKQTFLTSFNALRLCINLVCCFVLSLVSMCSLFDNQFEVTEPQ